MLFAVQSSVGFGIEPFTAHIRFILPVGIVGIVLGKLHIFLMGTKGGGSFFGKVGSFEEGYEVDAIVLDESRIPHPQKLNVKERLERFIYLSGDDWVLHKYVKGRQLF